MVKPDVKHNYYADLELPTSASIDDIRKAYRKLALQYHPDRNAGKETECVPKFQAIQAANEVLGDSMQKQKYDSERRKAGLYPTFRPGQPGPANPYAANSAYPPPPRRTQPGTWQRPQPSAATGTPNGADRFTNFPRPAPTARKDPAQGRTNMFKAWQNMNTAQERQRNFTQPGPQPAPQPNSTRQRPPPPPPPPRQEGKMPTEEQIRAGMHYRHPQNVFDAEEADQRQRDWSNFQRANAGKPGVTRSNTTRTPRKQGFNPNAPGSDERAAPQAGSRYFHRHKSEDYGSASADQQFPRSPPGPPPASTPSSPPRSPAPYTHRPYGDPLRQSRSRVEPDDNIPFAEGNRTRTPYSSFIGEKTDFSHGDSLRRSASHRDTAKAGAEDAANRARARSSSPPRVRPSKTGSKQNPFVVYSSSDDDDPIEIPSRYSDLAQEQHKPGTASHSASFDRPMKTPTPPSRRFNGSVNPTSPPMPHVPPTCNATNGARYDGEQADMQQKAKHNMYADPSISNHIPQFSSRVWAARMFGSCSTSSVKQCGPKVPSWAVPSSLNPTLKTEKPALFSDSLKSKNGESGKGAPEKKIHAEKNDHDAYVCFQKELKQYFGGVPSNLNLKLFLKLASTAQQAKSSGDECVDRLLNRTLRQYPSVGCTPSSKDTMANDKLRASSFNFRHDPDMFSSNTESRSKESINTDFSQGWTGEFTGEPDYFAPPPSTGRRQPSPPRRKPAPYRESASQRSATMDAPTPTGVPNVDLPPPRAWGSDGLPRVEVSSPEPSGTRFSKEEWEKTFQDSSWTWPPPPAKPSSPIKNASAGGRKQSRRPSKPNTSGSKDRPHIVDEDDTVEVEGVNGRPESGTSVPPNLDPRVDSGDAMDIDTTPPPSKTMPPPPQSPTQVQKEKEAKIYPVPSSNWRHQQQENGLRTDRRVSNASRHTSRISDDSKFATNLDDLRNVEPMGRSAGKDGLKDFSDLTTELPFPSEPSVASLDPKRLEVPKVPVPPEAPTKLAKASWNDYVHKFASYLQAHHNFNKVMLLHFAERQRQVDEMCAEGMDFVGATGVTSGMLRAPSGYGHYLQGVKEDEAVRETWNVGCERHADASKRFEKVREQVRKLVLSSGLQDA